MKMEKGEGAGRERERERDRDREKGLKHHENGEENQQMLWMTESRWAAKLWTWRAKCTTQCIVIHTFRGKLLKHRTKEIITI